jgi:hypothetical protein
MFDYRVGGFRDCGVAEGSSLAQAKTALCTTNAPFPGDHTGGDTPVPIPNTAVKPVWADDSPQGESRSSPGFFLEHPCAHAQG